MPLPPQTTSAVRRKYCQLLFETFNVPATYLAHASVLSLLASGSGNLTGARPWPWLSLALALSLCLMTLTDLACSHARTHTRTHAMRQGLA
jgi:actin-related protein